jgi:hypothetical protein
VRQRNPLGTPWCEVSEEVGLLVRVDRLVGVYAMRARADLVFNFLCVPVGGSIHLSDDADDVQWVSHADIPSNTSPRQRERIGDVFADHHGVFLKVQA